VDLGDIPFGDEELAAVEKKMVELARLNNEFVRTDVSKKDAIEYFKKKGDEYKLELIDGLTDGSITFYQQGNFVDLCRGPHIPTTAPIKAIKLLSVAGAYWRGDEKNKMLKRIYGITFPKQKELEEYLFMLEEAKKRDHRKLGKELELFAFSEKVGNGACRYGYLKEQYFVKGSSNLCAGRRCVLVTTLLLLHILEVNNFMLLPGITKNMGKILSNPFIHPMKAKSFCLNP
jgi:threonyl-tRNA synthetase